MRNMLLIAQREYLEQIKGRAFRLSTIGLPALFALILGVAYLSGRGLGANKHVVIVSADRALSEAVRVQLLGEKGKQAVVDVAVPAGPETRTELTDRVAGKSIDGFLWIDDSGVLPTASYTAQTAGDFMTATRLKEALDDGFVAEHLSSAGMDQGDVDSVVKGINISTYQVKESGSRISVVKVNAQASFWKGYVMAILLSMTTMIYGMNVARSIIQEKTSRIFEVMLATAKPSDMLAGKLIGVGAVGLTQIAIWLVAGVAIVGSPMAAAILSGQYSVHFSWVEGVLFPVYFLLGYMLYSSLFAGLAATCETEQELQMYMPLAAAPTWLSFAMIWPIINDSNSVWSVSASLFPPTAPIVMFLRMASEIPPAWQFAASLGLMAVSIWGTLWISSRLYRVGILMYGKRATLPELLRWLRYS
jgi:ABC-2 type transport system permease protein